MFPTLPLQHNVYIPLFWETAWFGGLLCRFRALQNMIWCDMIWYDMTSHGMTWYLIYVIFDIYIYIPWKFFVHQSVCIWCLNWCKSLGSRNGTNHWDSIFALKLVTVALFQYPIRRFIARFRKVLKPRDLYLELHGRSEIWQAHRQQGCRCACPISKRCDNLNYQSGDFETPREYLILIEYWNQTDMASLLYFFHPPFVGADSRLHAVSHWLWF